MRNTDADDASTLTCLWTIDGVPQPEWSPAVLNETTGAFDCPLNLGALSLGIGDHTLSLEAFDGEAASFPDEMILTITNTAPHANAGPDVIIT
ncbi:MAG: hypothetical protein HZA16_13120 [Nitrospirae bacterium]|nr:hypothetical protein [Nitrospirota bacterium]